MAKDERQLYDIFLELQVVVPDNNALGSAVGYSIVKGLAEFSSDSGSEQERQFQEVKSIYSELERAVSHYKGGETFLDIELAGEMGPVISSKGDYDGLLKRVVDHLSSRRGAVEDVVRRKGLSLVSGVLERGRQAGTRNMLLEDYRSVEEYFTG